MSPALNFKKATKKNSRARIAFVGPAGSGKTFSGLSVATGLGSKIAVIDSERGSASKYAHKFNFDVLELETFSPDAYIAAIRLAGQAGYEVLLIDSLSHAWAGKDGALEMVDNAMARGGGNKFAAWRHVTPKHNELVDAILQSTCHVIVTMRAKTEYVLEKDDKGKTVPRKIGIAPVQRDGLEYEFDVVGDIDGDHVYAITKTRCEGLDRKVFQNPGVELAGTIKHWLEDGVVAATSAAPVQSEVSAAAPTPAAPAQQRPASQPPPTRPATAPGQESDLLKDPAIKARMDEMKLNPAQRTMRVHKAGGDKAKLRELLEMPPEGAPITPAAAPPVPSGPDDEEKYLDLIAGALTEPQLRQAEATAARNLARLEKARPGATLRISGASLKRLKEIAEMARSPEKPEVTHVERGGDERF